MSATEDLLYIAQRIKGITDLIPLLQSIESLDNYKSELEKNIEEAKTCLTSIETLRSEHQKALEDQTVEFTSIEQKIAESQKKHDGILKSIESLKSKF